MTQSYCTNCSLFKLRINEYVNSYQELIATKDSEIECSHKIISQLQAQLAKSKNKIRDISASVQNQQKYYLKVINEQTQTLQYYRGRQVQLLEKVKKIEADLFHLQKDKQDKIEEISLVNSKSQRAHLKSTYAPNTDRNVHNDNSEITLGIKDSTNKQNSSFQRIWYESSVNKNDLNYHKILNIARKSNQNNHDSIQLKICEDHLNMMDVKYKIALLKAVEIEALK